MSTRNFSGADRPSRSSSVSSRTCSISSRSLTRWLSCQRQSFHCSSGISAQSGARRLTAGRPSAPSTRAGSAKLTNGVSAARAASWWATADLISWASNAGWPPVARARPLAHKVYAVCKPTDDSAMVRVRSTWRVPRTVTPERGLLPDDRPEQAHRDEEAAEEGDQAQRAVGRAGALVRDQLQADPEAERPEDEQEAEQETGVRVGHLLDPL